MPTEIARQGMNIANVESRRSIMPFFRVPYQQRKCLPLCSQNITKFRFAFIFQVFNLTHKCACPNACLIRPTKPTTKEPTTDPSKLNDRSLSQT